MDVNLPVLNKTVNNLALAPWAKCQIFQAIKRSFNFQIGVLKMAIHGSPCNQSNGTSMWLCENYSIFLATNRDVDCVT